MKYILTIVFFVLVACNSKKQVNNTVVLGFIADCQYADQPAVKKRQYQLSIEKLKQSIDTFNNTELDHVFLLGDLIDKDEKNYMKVLPIVNQLNKPFSMVLGNHDFSVSDLIKNNLPTLLGLDERYYKLTIKDWKFILLDGTDISLYGQPENDPKYEEALEIHSLKYIDKPRYNGALGKKQMEWLKSELVTADKQKQKVIILCHFPILPDDDHVLWNSEEVLDLISSHKCVKAWLNGHNHAGEYAIENGIHFVTLKGMVDTKENAFAKITLHDDKIILEGYGREPDKTLNIKGNF